MAHGMISSKNTNKNKKIDKVKRSLTLRCLCQYCDPRYDRAGQCSEFRLSGLSASHVIIYCDFHVIQNLDLKHAYICNFGLV